MPKRKQSYKEEEIRKKIKKYEEKLQKYVSPQTPVDEAQPTSDIIMDIIQDNACEESQIQDIVCNVETVEVEEETLDSEILDLLGEAPQAQKFGPAIHKELASRWASIIKTGLTKDKKSELRAKYLPPENCKTIDAPKLNLEAQAAMVEMAVKRDKAISSKQGQVGCVLTAMGRALGKLINKGKENLEVINHIGDAARLLCDHQYQESMTRKHFILQGLDQSIRNSIKDTEVDEWLFGEGFADKLKASKAIKKSGQEISAKFKKPQLQQKKPLNFRGPGNNQPRSQVNKPGPRQSTYQSYKKLAPQTVKPQNRAPLRAPTNRN